MAVVQGNIPYVKSRQPAAAWEGFTGALPWPKGISVKERTRIFRKGKNDARHGLVQINEFNEFISPFFEELVHQANQRIALTWMECEEKASQLCISIETVRQSVANVDRKLRDLGLEEREAVDRVENMHYDGDDAVSAHMAERRRFHRIRPIQERYEREREALLNERFRIAQEAISYQYELRQAREVAQSHEQLIRADYLWRLSIYAYGASAYVRITPDMVNDAALSQEPHERYERTYGAMIQNVLHSDDE